MIGRIHHRYIVPGAGNPGELISDIGYLSPVFETVECRVVDSYLRDTNRAAGGIVGKALHHFAET